MPRFVILYHDCPPGHDRPSHWDLMLQVGETLRTWAVKAIPLAEEPAEAERLADHRLAYLEYEGPISGGRGSVKRWDTGEFTLQEDAPDKLAFELHGTYLVGQWVLTRERNAEARHQLWSLRRA